MRLAETINSKKGTTLGVKIKGRFLKTPSTLQNRNRSASTSKRYNRNANVPYLSILKSQIKNVPDLSKENLFPTKFNKIIIQMPSSCTNHIRAESVPPIISNKKIRKVSKYSFGVKQEDFQ